MTRSKLIRSVLMVALAVGATPTTAQDVAQADKGWLGLRIQQALPNGAYVGDIEERSPAKTAGIMPGDVIIEFDGQKVGQSQDLPRIVASTPVGKQVKVVVLRGGSEQNLTVRIGQMDESQNHAIANGEVNCTRKEECHFLLGKMITALQAIAASRPSPKADDISAWHLVNQIYTNLMEKLPPQLKNSVMDDRKIIDAMLRNESNLITRAEQQRDLAQKQLLAGQIAPGSPSPSQPAVPPAAARSASAGNCNICGNVDGYASSAYSSGIQANGYYTGEPEGQLQRDYTVAGLLADYLVLMHCKLDNGSDLLVKLGEKIETQTMDMPDNEKQSISLLAKRRAGQSIGSIDYQINVQRRREASQCKEVFDADTMRFNPPKPPFFEPSQTSVHVTPKQLGWLGVRTLQVIPGGAPVTNVAEGSPAKAAGILAGDLIVEFDGEKIARSQDLTRIVASTPPGKVVEIVIVRGDQEQRLTVKLGQTVDTEALMREVVPPDAVCQRSGIGRDCEYSPQNGPFRIKLNVYDHGELEFGIRYPDIGDTRYHTTFDVNAYAPDITHALGAMKLILEQQKYGFDNAQINQCLKLPIAQVGHPPNQFQAENKEWTLTCRKGSESYKAFFHIGDGFTEIHADIRATPPPPRNRF